MMSGLRVLVADDHELIRRAVRSDIEATRDWTVAEARDGKDALKIATDFQPDVAFLDVSMQRLSGPATINPLHAVSPTTKVIMLTMWDSEVYFTEALRAGARGYLLKSSEEIDFVSAVEAVQAGRFFFSMSIADKMVAAFLKSIRAPEETFAPPLTMRESEVLSMLARGCTNKEVAAQLGISPRTAETHRHHIYRKLHFSTTADLVRYALAHDLVKDC